MTKLDQAAAVVDSLRGFKKGDKVTKVATGEVGYLESRFTNPFHPDFAMRDKAYWVIGRRVEWQDNIWYEDELAHAD